MSWLSSAIKQKSSLTLLLALSDKKACPGGYKPHAILNPQLGCGACSLQHQRDMNKKRFFKHRNASDLHSSTHRIASISLLGERPSLFRAGTSHLTYWALIVNDLRLFKHLTEESNFLIFLMSRNLVPVFGSKGSACFIARPPEMESLACSAGPRGVSHGG